MYREESSKRLFARINYLKIKQTQTSDLMKKLELTIRINNLKTILDLINSDQNYN